MGGHDRCSLGGCNNDKRHPEKMIIRGHVSKLVFHKFPPPTDPVRRNAWIQKCSKGRDDFNPDSEWIYACSNHFFDGKPTRENPLPTLYLKVRCQEKLTKKT